MKNLITFFFSLFLFSLNVQAANIKGQLQDPNGEAVIYANVILYSAKDSSLIKAETSDDTGVFNIRNIDAGSYFLKATYVGFADLESGNIILAKDQAFDLGVLTFESADESLAQVTVTASRALVEVKPDRTVFNVEGTINSAGSDALALMRKAPGVTVDNNDNINVLGRSGVMIYVDGKRLPLSGDDLTNYLQNLPAEQIDRIDIITNPGAKYEAQGNAGIIDIRLKRDKNLGTNGSISASYSKGEFDRYNLNGSINYRNKSFNAFGTLGYGEGTWANDIVFDGNQNGSRLNEFDEMQGNWGGYNFRIGSDFFMGKQHTIGFLIGRRQSSHDRTTDNLTYIYGNENLNIIDSTLHAFTDGDGNRDQNTYNLNYRFDNGKGRSLNIDGDYGQYINPNKEVQKNWYTFADRPESKKEVTNFDTPTDINIYTFKVDFEDDLLGGKFGIGTKYSKVATDNNFLVSNGQGIQIDSSSNTFDYDESVYAGYLSYAHPLGKKWNISAGLRTELTDATGDLHVFDITKKDTLFEQNYLTFFPNIGLTWQMAPNHMFGLNYGRRINRPDYNVLNPFVNQLSELSFEKGNAELKPEIVNNIELSYTLAYRFNFKLGFSRTTDQITRLIGPDPIDSLASYISWDNLATQDLLSLSASLPFQVNKWWSAYFNLSGSYLDNQADYGDGAIVDIQAFTYSFYSQQTFTLPAGFKGEVSGFYSGPGVWGGVFKYDSSWALNLGLQKKFLKDRMNVKLSLNDIFKTQGWSGSSEFDGLISTGSGNWDSRRASISLSYRFGNDKVKSRKRKTGLEDEADRVQSGNQ